jgi:hypothetical protein
MSKKIKSIKRFNQHYRNFNFSDLTSRADAEVIELDVVLDENGNTLEEIKYGSDGQPEEKNSYTYDKKGKLLTHILLYVVEDVTQKRILTRNEKGNLLSEEKYYGDDSGEKTVYEYDEKDNIINILYYDEEGDYASKNEIKYNEKGEVTERISLNNKNKILSRIAFSVPEEHHIEESEYDENNKLVSKTLMVFNKDGKEVTTRQTNPQGKLISAVQNTYDERGNVIQRVYKDFYSKTIKYTYDENNLLTDQELYDDNGLLLRKNMYEYDDDGNIIAEQTYEMDTTRGGRDKHFGTRYEYVYW